jgi:hypothetical protein
VQPSKNGLASEQNQELSTLHIVFHKIDSGQMNRVFVKPYHLDVRLLSDLF